MTPEEQRRDVGFALLILACALVALVGGVLAILSYVGG